MIFRIILLLFKCLVLSLLGFDFIEKREAGETMQHLNKLVEKAKLAIESIQDKSLTVLDEIRVEYFGKKGHFTQLMQELRNVSAEERPAIGAKINEAKQAALEFLNAKKAEWEQAELNAKLEKERVDVSLPDRKVETVGLHPARADHDTFWFNPELLLRTQTSVLA